MKTSVLGRCVVRLSFCALDNAAATDCVWLANPASNNWNTAENWSCQSVPAYQDSIFFAESNQTQISITEQSDADVLTFQPAASAYEIDVEPAASVDVGYGIDGRVSGITNLSGVMQNFVVKSDSTGGGGIIYLYGNAGVLSTFTSESQRAADGYSGHIWLLVDQSQFGPTTAGRCKFINQGGVFEGGQGGVTQFSYGASGDAAVIVDQAGVVNGAGGGLTVFSNNSSGGHASITSEGATISGALGGITKFDDATKCPGGTLIAEGGSSGGGGGTIQFWSHADADGATVEVCGNGNLVLEFGDIAYSIGSLQGDGLVLLQGHRLKIGATGFDSTFSGSIQDDGSVVKLGAGTMTLSGVNTYTGGTIVTAGVLLANSATGSATGSGFVNINAGILGGHGRISGPVRIGTGSGAGAFLEPSFGSNRPSRLRISQRLTFQPDSTYTYKVRTEGAQGDEVWAHDVSIQAGAQFDLQQIANKKLASGTVFSVIDNISFHPISGSFANLADGSVIIAGQNKFKANYTGGDGNNLTLTVVP